MIFGRIVYNYPEEFNQISEYAQAHNLNKIKEEKLNEGKQRVKEYLDKVKKGK